MVLSLQLAVEDGDRQAPAAGHRIARVDREIEQDGLELMRVAHDVRLAVAELEREPDLGAEGSSQKLLHAGDEMVRLDAGRLQRLAAGEREQAVGQASGAVQNPPHLFEEAVDAFEPAARDAALDQCQSAGDRLDHVVEVVRDSAGQLADDLHLLRLIELLLGLLERRIGLPKLRGRRKHERDRHEPPERDCGEYRHEGCRRLDDRLDPVDGEP